MKATKTSFRPLTAAFAAGLLGVAAIAAAQTAVTLTPLKGQSAEQMNKDQAECTSIAQQSAPAPAAPKRGGALKGAAVGAAVGAGTANHRGGEAYDRAPEQAKDAYREDQAQRGAAAGAALGAMRQRRENQQAQAAGNQALDAAFRSCLTGRGYQVK